MVVNLFFVCNNAFVSNEFVFNCIFFTAVVFFLYCWSDIVVVVVLLLSLMKIRVGF